MKLYWSLHSIPELSSLPAAQRGRVWRACCLWAFRHWQTWIGLLLCGVCFLIGFYGGLLVLRTFSGSLSFWIAIIIAACGGGVGGFINGQIAVEQVRPYLRRYLERNSQTNVF